MLSDAAARREALDPARSFIVQAPAGSGKTELLTQRYLRLLAGVQAPEQILAITFTRKAAAEMRHRILEALAASDRAPPESEHKRATWALARAVRDIDATYEWRLAQHPARLRVMTIDALNASLARRLPVLSQSGAALEPTDDAQPLYEAACQALIERLGVEPTTTAPLEALISHLGNRVDRLVVLLSSLLAKRDQWLHPIIRARTSARLRETLEGALRAVIERHLHALIAALDAEQRRELLEVAQYAAGNLLAGGSPAPARRALLEACLSRTEPLSGASDCLAVWRAVSAMLFKPDGELYAKVDVRHGFPPAGAAMKARMSALLRTLSLDAQLRERLLELASLPDAAYREDQWRILDALLELLPAATAELQLVFQTHGRVDYIEVALRGLQALGPADEPTDAALAFDHRLQHILIDEFQDTSFSQLDLLERLTGGWVEGDGRTLFCVGDPMQSIYRFRQAEVGLFLELQRRGLNAVRLTPLQLTANFRSSPKIVRWVNEVFPQVLAVRDDAEQGAVKYSPSSPALSIPGAVRLHPFVNADDLAEANCVLELVRDALERDPVGSVAVLVTARTHVEAIAQALTGAGVEFQAVEIERLRERPPVQDLIALTRALVHVADRTAWLSVLRAPWCGLTLPDLHAIAAGWPGALIDALATARASAPAGLSSEGAARLTRVVDVLEAALAERGRYSLGVWVERAWNALGGPATLARAQDLEDAEAFFARLADLEVAGDLEDVARLEEQLERLFARPRVRGAMRVEVMTMHAAKGLEFDTVILPGLHRAARAENRELLRWTRIAGVDGGFVLAPIKAEGGEPDPIYRWIELLERERVMRERGRLLYVAATRAKRTLHLIGNVEAGVRNGETVLREPRTGSLLKMLWPAVAQQFEAAAPTPDFAATAALPLRLPQTLRRLPLNWRAPEAPALATSDSTPLNVIDMQRPEFDWASEAARHVGTLVHRELERRVRAKSTQPLASERQRLLLELRELGVPEDRADLACERVIAAIEGTLADRRGRWLLGLEGEVREAESELPLTGVIEGRLIEGVIDRTFIDAQGVRWIVDFKTSTHEGGGLDAFLAEETTRYRTQLTRYARLLAAYRPREPVRAALYFPLLGAWREVPLG